MPNFNNVNPDDVWSPEPAGRYNAVNDLLRQHSGTGGGYRRGFSGNTCIPVYNNTGETLDAYTCVGIHPNQCKITHDGYCFAVREYSNDAGIVGVLQAPVQAHEIGHAVVLGTCFAHVEGEVADYADIDSSTPGMLRFSESGPIRVLMKKSPALILLGEACEPQKRYYGSFETSLDDGQTLNVSGGIVLRNDDMVFHDGAAGIKPESGYLCVCSKIGDDETWDDIDIRFNQPGPTAWPIAEIEVDVETEKITVRPRYTNVALLLVAAQCPMAEF